MNELQLPKHRPAALGDTPEDFRFWCVTNPDPKIRNGSAGYRETAYAIELYEVRNGSSDHRGWYEDLSQFQQDLLARVKERKRAKQRLVDAARKREEYAARIAAEQGREVRAYGKSEEQKREYARQKKAKQRAAMDPEERRERQKIEKAAQRDRKKVRSADATATASNVIEFPKPKQPTQIASAPILQAAMIDRTDAPAPAARPIDHAAARQAELERQMAELAAELARLDAPQITAPTTDAKIQEVLTDQDQPLPAVARKAPEADPELPANIQAALDELDLGLEGVTPASTNLSGKDLRGFDELDALAASLAD